MGKKSSEIATAYGLEQFFHGIGKHLKDRRKRESFAMYAFGILGDGERKSAEPIAAPAPLLLAESSCHGVPRSPSR